jgi:hypothetical protein
MSRMPAHDPGRAAMIRTGTTSSWVHSPWHVTCLRVWMETQTPKEAGPTPAMPSLQQRARAPSRVRALSLFGAAGERERGAEDLDVRASVVRRDDA